MWNEIVSLFRRNKLVTPVPSPCNEGAIWAKLRAVEKHMSEIDNSVREAFNRGNSAHTALSRLKSELSEPAAERVEDPPAEVPSSTHPVRQKLRAGVSMRRLRRNGS